MSQYYTSDHLAFQETVRRFVAKEIEPNINDWEEAGEFPRELYEKAASVGLLQIGFPEEVGGIAVDSFYRIIAFQELSRAGSGGLSAGLTSHTIGSPPIALAAKEAVRSVILEEVLSGKKISALAITEPSGGSDVANMKTSARRDGDGYVLNGEKTFITSGMRADYITVAARTGGSGAGGISLFVVNGDNPGLQRTSLKKMGWWSSDTATLYFSDCRIPEDYLLGNEGEGFRLIMHNFNAERITLAAGGTALARVCLDEAVAYAQERQTFGRRLIEHQVIRHKLVEMAMRINASQALLESLAWRVDHGESPVAESLI